MKKALPSLSLDPPRSWEGEDQLLQPKNSKAVRSSRGRVTIIRLLWKPQSQHSHLARCNKRDRGSIQLSGLGGWSKKQQILKSCQLHHLRRAINVDLANTGVLSGVDDGCLRPHFPPSSGFDPTQFDPPFDPPCPGEVPDEKVFRYFGFSCRRSCHNIQLCFGTEPW
jgi:hypothetical protein